MTATRSFFLVLIAFCLCLTALAACGDDDSSTPDAGTSTGGKSGSGGKGTAGSSGGGAAGQPGIVKCGSMTCTASPAAALLGTGATPCCADQTTSTCGMTAQDGSCMKPVESDPRCPSVNIMGFIMLPSCCSDGGQCGINAAMFGMPGCVELAQAAMLAGSMGGGGLVALPAARACDAADGGAADAGN